VWLIESAALAVDSRCTLGEGVLWCAQRRALLWTDIQNSRLWIYSPAEARARSWTLPDRMGSMALCRSGRLLLGLAKGLFLTELDTDREEGAIDQLRLSPVVPVEPDQPSTRINDGRTDRAGNFVFGTMNEDPSKAPIGAFYQYSVRFGLRRLDLGGVYIPNSICFSLDGGTMYFCDSGQRRILQCDYDAESASAASVRDFLRFGEGQGVPDGSVIDEGGCLWNAEWGAAMVRRYTPGGRIDRSISVPAKNPTCPVFGGDHLDQLYITSSRQEMSGEELARMSEAGGVFVASPGVRGVPDALFADGLEPLAHK
jgi:sugar lactone lactonase YvrE